MAPFTHETIRYMGMYFPRNFITTAKHVVVVEKIKYLGKYMTICLILAYEKEAIYILSTVIAYLCVIDAKHFLNDPHSKKNAIMSSLLIP